MSNPNRGRISVALAANWRIYWGPGPLPHGADAVGTVHRGEETGALLRFPAGYMMGRAGALASLPPHKVAAAIRAAGETP